MLSRSLLLAACLPAFGGCASTSQAGAAAVADERSARCPAGSTMVCEANRIGRIVHGSFSGNGEKCACVPDDGRMLDTPVIPSTQR